MWSFLFLFCFTSVKSLETYIPIETINLNVGGYQGDHGDWVAYDADTKTIWLSHGPDQNVIILDTDLYNVRAVVPYVTKGNGITFTKNFALVADNEADTVRIYDKSDLSLKQVLETPGGPDGVYWDSGSNSIWVTMDDTSSVLQFIPAPTGEPRPYNPFPAANISLITPVTTGSKGPDVGVLVNDRFLFQPIDTVLNVIDIHYQYVANVFTLPFEGVGGAGSAGATAKGLAFDPQTGNILVGTNWNESFLVSSFDGSIVATIDLPGPVDESVIVREARRGYQADKLGFFDVIDLDAGRLLQSVPTAPGAHTLTAIQYEQSTEVWSYQDQYNQVVVYEWIHH